MSRNENPPFDRGQTFFGGGTVDATSGANLEGLEWVFNDFNYSTKVNRTNSYVRCRVVRNTSGIALLPKRLVSFEASGTDYGKQVDGYTTTVAARGYLVDEWLPTTGVPNNDLFWIVIEGPATGLCDIAAVDTISVGDKLVALTAVTSQATTAGRLDLFDATGATLPLANQCINYIGYALSAKTSANTNSDLLMLVGHW